VKRWRLPPRYPEAEALARRLSLAPPAVRVLWHRGLRDPEAVQTFLDASLERLHDPFLMKGMEEAVARLLRAVRDREAVLIYGDYDVDGTTAVVILKKALELAEGRANYFIPDRFAHGYGIHEAVIEQAAREGFSLVVSVDTGIRAQRALELATGLGLDVIITDHHPPGEALPPALAVLNPKQPGCSYPDKSLSGAGVVFKLVQGLFLRLGWSGRRLESLLDSFLKMVAIATIADVVPLVGENRVFVRRGLAALESVRNLGLKALFEVAGIEAGRLLSVRDVAFLLAPRINAAGRMAAASEVVELFFAQTEEQARAVAQRLNQWNAERQKAEQEILQQIEAEIAACPVSPERRGLLFAGEGWHHGVVGIVAGRLAERFQRPVFVLGINPETGQARGSGRSVPGFNLLEALETMKDLFERFGGHAQAAGVTLAAGRVEEFRQRFEAYCAAHLSEEDLKPTLEIDSYLDLRELTEQAFHDILELGPFGYGNPPPVFLVEKAELSREPAVFGDSHLWLTLRQGNRHVPVCGWSLAERLGEFGPGQRLDAVLTIEPNPTGPARGYAPWVVSLLDYCTRNG